MFERNVKKFWQVGNRNTLITQPVINKWIITNDISLTCYEMIEIFENEYSESIFSFYLEFKSMVIWFDINCSKMLTTHYSHVKIS